MRRAATIRVFITIDGDATEEQFDAFVADMCEHFQAEAYHFAREEDGGMNYDGELTITSDSIYKGV